MWTFADIVFECNVFILQLMEDALKQKSLQLKFCFYLYSKFTEASAFYNSRLVYICYLEKLYIFNPLFVIINVLFPHFPKQISRALLVKNPVFFSSPPDRDNSISLQWQRTGTRLIGSPPTLAKSSGCYEVIVTFISTKSFQFSLLKIPSRRQHLARCHDGIGYKNYCSHVRCPFGLVHVLLVCCHL